MNIFILCFSAVLSLMIKTTEFPHYIIPKEEQEILLQVGVLEAGGEDVEAIARVMQVVINRMFCIEYFPNTVYDVVNEKNQFETASHLENATITDQAYEALQDVLYGKYKDFDALFFESCPGRIWEDRYDYISSYGGHDFYTIKK